MIWWDNASHGENALEYNRRIVEYIQLDRSDVQGIINKAMELMQEYGFKVRL